jgi:hypothetical protein
MKDKIIKYKIRERTQQEINDSLPLNLSLLLDNEEIKIRLAKALKPYLDSIENCEVCKKWHS